MNAILISSILNKYPETYVLVEGHTDATGTAEYNKILSERRARSVAGFLKEKYVKNTRIKTAWYGETQPKYQNDSETNRAKNRRVEFAIYATEKLVQQAKEESMSK